MKSLSVKQAEKWLQRLKNANPNSYKELSKELRRYDKRNDQYDCFVKMNKTLLNHPDLTNQINNYLEEGNKFVVSMSEIDRINNLMKYIKKEKPEIYQQISAAIRNMTNDGDQDRQDNEVKDLVLNSVKGNQRLQAYADKVLNFTAEDFLNKLDLEHLKNNRQSQPPDDIDSVEIKGKQPRKIPKTHVQPVITQRIKNDYVPPIKNNKWPFPPLTSPTEEKNFIRSLEKKLKPKDFQELTKIVHIYYLNVISKGEVIEFIKKIVGSEDDFEYITDILEARETDRRRNSCFRPLIDFDYHNAERGTHSYVSMPKSYPTLCSTKVGLPKDILNSKWISIPRGSEDFNVRSKNQYEQNLLKAEDERYEFDLYIRRLKKAEGILNKILNALNAEPNQDCTKQINTIISLGIVQLIYKNGNKDQKEELQFFLKRNTLEAAKLFSDRIKTQIIELEDIKKIHGFKNWNEVAQKNWQKSQDFKGFAFKKSEKDKMKSNIFLNELNIRLKYLECKGELKALQTPFQDKKQFFSVFNSFQSSSRIEKCISRKTAPPIVYDIKDFKIPTLLPVMIMAFEDEEACSTAYSFMVYYLQNSGVTETEKIRCRNFFREIMAKFFKWQNFRYRTISSSFDEEVFYGQFGPEQKKPALPNLDEWITDESDVEGQGFEREQFKLPSFNYLEDEPSEYVYQPPKSKDNEIFFSSEHFYVFLRFLYALYERIIRMREVADTKEKIKLFELLYFTSIKTKESAKFEDCLTQLFSNHAHIFSTIYKLLESLAKSLNAVSLCNITNESMKFIDIKCEQIYILLLNRYYLNNSISNSKILRFAFELDNKLLYINSLESYYKSDDQGKDLNKKRCQITRDIEYYTIEGITDHKDNEKTLLKNGFEYSFEGNTIKMSNLLKNEDLIANKKVALKKKEIEGELKKSYDFWKTQQ